MRGVTDDVLMAWVDGELDPATAARVAALVQADDALRQRAAGLRLLTLDLRQAFEADLHEPVPAALAAAAQGPAPRASAEILALHPPPRPAATAAAQPAARAPWHARLGWAHWGGIAAALLLALVLVPPWGMRGGDAPLLAQGDGGRLLASGALAQALDRSLASDSAGAAVRVTLSFRDHDGRYCRSFAAPAGRGLACRDGGAWQVVVLAAPGPAAPADTMRLAGGDLPDAVLDAVERRIAGLALDAAQERAARDAGWAR